MPPSKKRALPTGTPPSRKLFNACRYADWIPTRSSSSVIFVPIRASMTASNAPCLLDDQNPRLTPWMGNMLTSNAGVKQVASLHFDDALASVLPIVHVDPAIEDGEHLLAVIDMPPVRPIGPMEAGRDAPHIRDLERVPCVNSPEVLGTNESRRHENLGEVFAIHAPEAHRPADARDRRQPGPWRAALPAPPTALRNRARQPPSRPR